MQIRTRMCTSLDGYVTTPDGWPAQLADPNFSAESFGFVEFQKSLDAVLMGRTTFEPAIGAERWPWGELDVFVLGSEWPAGTPDRVVCRERSGAPARADPRGEPRRRRASRRRAQDDRHLPLARRARQARSDRAAVPARRGDAVDAFGEHRRRVDA